MPTWPLMAVVLVVMILVLYEGWNVPPRYWGQASIELPKKTRVDWRGFNTVGLITILVGVR